MLRIDRYYGVKILQIVIAFVDDDHIGVALFIVLVFDVGAAIGEGHALLLGGCVDRSDHPLAGLVIPRLVFRHGAIDLFPNSFLFVIGTRFVAAREKFNLLRLD